MTKNEMIVRGVSVAIAVAAIKISWWLAGALVFAICIAQGWHQYRHGYMIGDDPVPRLPTERENVIAGIKAAVFLPLAMAVIFAAIFLFAAIYNNGYGLYLLTVIVAVAGYCIWHLEAHERFPGSKTKNPDWYEIPKAELNAKFTSWPYWRGWIGAIGLIAIMIGLAFLIEPLLS